MKLNALQLFTKISSNSILIFQGTLKGMDCHEISIYYLMKPRGTKQLNSDSYSQGVRETMHWIPIKDLDKYKAFPTFLKEYLSKEHAGIEHIITDERK